MTLALPYSHLNLRWNPFGHTPPEVLARLTVAELDPLVDFLRSGRRALQFIGEAGRGKSTHLHALTARLPGARYCYVELEGHADLRDAQTLVVDEMQRASRALRRQVLASKRPLVLGTHADLTPALVRSGYEVRTVQVRGLDVQRLTEIYALRLEWARRAAGDLPALEPGHARDLISRHGDDLRSIQSELYEAFAAGRSEDHGSL